MLSYREWAPPAPLSGVVQCFWRVECAGGHGDELGTYCFSDAAPGLALTLEGAWREAGGSDDAPAACAFGPSTRLARVAYAPGTVVIAASLHPWAAAAVLGVTPSALLNQRVDLESAWGAEAGLLLESARAAASDDQAVGALAARLERRAAGVEDRARTLVASIVEGGGERIGERAGAAGISRQHLRRLVVRHTGLSPKRLARLARFQDALAACLDGDVEWADVAARCGYADQSHLIAEFREFAGAPPQALRRALVTLPADRC